MRGVRVAGTPEAAPAAGGQVSVVRGVRVAGAAPASASSNGAVSASTGRQTSEAKPEAKPEQLSWAGEVIINVKRMLSTFGVRI